MRVLQQRALRIPARSRARAAPLKNSEQERNPWLPRVGSPKATVGARSQRNGSAHSESLAIRSARCPTQELGARAGLVAAPCGCSERSSRSKSTKTIARAPNPCAIKSARCPPHKNSRSKSGTLGCPKHQEEQEHKGTAARAPNPCAIKSARCHTRARSKSGIVGCSAGGLPKAPAARAQRNGSARSESLRDQERALLHTRTRSKSRTLGCPVGERCWRIGGRRNAPVGVPPPTDPNRRGMVLCFALHCFALHCFASLCLA